VGLFALGLIANMYVIISEDMSIGYAAINPANIQLFTAAFDESLVDSLRHVSGVREVEGARLVSLRYKDRDGMWAQMDVKAIPDIDETRINRVTLQSGVWPPADRQLVVDRYKAGDLPGGIGDYIEIELPSGKIRKMQLVGIVHDQSIGSTDSGGFFLSPVTGYITLETLTWLEYPETMNQLYVADQSPNDPRLYTPGAASSAMKPSKAAPVTAPPCVHQ
jgi:putative ABC transport system permease protein